MTSRIAAIALDAVDPGPVADFWCAVLGWQRVDEDEEGISIAAAPGSWPTIDVLVVPEQKAVKNRLHLDVRADGTSAADELARLEALGARRADVGQGPDVTWVVLADPEGNELCLLSRTVQDVEREAAGG
ncbi:VOC family protein [Pseudokineococcus basanitobsidens]|uniref:VOC family protein n=1 Tax=Pseudokineococcus basanitobsidens TaxID=1926649 RepID=A0ABU8RFC0_9ACTN